VIIESPLDLIFRDLFYRVPTYAGRNDVFLKLEGFNVTGSIKIKTAIALVEDLEQRGLARTDETVIVESSSGNLGLALSLVCAAKRYKFICVTDPNANRATLRGMELYGAKVVVVEERDAVGGYLGSRLKKINQILNSNPNALWLNQYANVANKKAHAEQTANEIMREFDRVDWVFVGTGTTGTLAGISERIRQKFSNITIVAVEPVGSITFGGAPAKRNIPGIGTSVRPRPCGSRQAGQNRGGDGREDRRSLSFLRSRLSSARWGKHRIGSGRSATTSSGVWAWRDHRRSVG